ncbi:helix-turn-helix transcriptional regulator [Streptoalloteichus hindustanus]|nr:helix-turn-helix transcriptional regulator [Streptoalloteichus hindustanus]
MYRERPSTLPGAVLWTRTVPADETEHRVLPDGCLDLIWHNGRLLVAGPDTTAQLGSSTPGATYTGLRFAPGIGPTVLGVPAHELRDRRVPLADLWPSARVRRLTERAAETPRPGHFLENLARDQLRDTTPEPSTRALVASIASGDSVTTTANALGLSTRQLHRRCLHAFGYGPKTLARILRMTRALTLARSGTPFAQVAAESGYADQAHLSREVRALAGIPLTQLITPPLRPAERSRDRHNR